AVVVKIPDTNSGRPAAAAKACFVRDVSEGTVTVVLIKTICRFRRTTLDLRSAENQNVHPAIVVVVNKGTTAAGCLKNVIYRVWIAVNHGCRQACTCGNIYEMRLERAPRGSRFGLGFDRARRNALSEQPGSRGSGGENDKVSA